MHYIAPLKTTLEAAVYAPARPHYASLANGNALVLVSLSCGAVEFTPAGRPRGNRD